MGKKPTPEQVEWQQAARERLLLVLEHLFGGNQSRLARALGVTQALVNIVVHEVQPPTRNLMARLGAVPRVNPRWADTGEGQPILPEYRGTLPVSHVLLPGPPAEHLPRPNRKRFAVASEYERPSCYFWRLPAGHPAVAVDAWRLLPGDLLLLETSRDVVEARGGLYRRWCVLDGGCLRRAEPVYGAVTADSQRRMVFSDQHFQLRFLDPLHSNLAPPDPPRRKKQGKRDKPQPGRWVNTEAGLDPLAPEREMVPWSQLPDFSMAQVLAVQLMLVRRC
jgi:hypothetical protein